MQIAPRCRQWIKRHRILALVLGCLLLLYALFAATRFTKHTLYLPVSGRVFNIRAENVEELRVENGNTGKTAQLREPGEIREAVDALNGFRYRFCTPAFPFPTGGNDCTIWLDSGGEQVYGRAVGYKVKRNAVFFHGLWYWGEDNYFSDLIGLASKQAVPEK